MTIIWINEKTGLHTHTPIFVRVEKAHHSHSHLSVTVTTGTTTHIHTHQSDGTVCGYAGSTSHTHSFLLGSADSHSHANAVLTFGSSNLGSPNWWVHTHSVALESMDAGGGAHTHLKAANSSYSGCIAGDCLENPHRHGQSLTGSSGSSGSSHTHTITGKSTGNANTVAPNTPESHTHNFSFYSDVGDSHSHSLTSPALTNAYCYYSRLHLHVVSSPSGTATHAHLVSGVTGDGGEALPSAGLRRLLVGVGL